MYSDCLAAGSSELLVSACVAVFVLMVVAAVDTLFLAVIVFLRIVLSRLSGTKPS